MKNNSYKIAFFILLMISAFYSVSYSQKLSTQADEERVKLSGVYYWEEQIAVTEEQAKNLAKDYLIFRIINDSGANKNMNDVKSINIEGIEYLIFMRDTRYRVIAYIEKIKVTKQLKTLRVMGYVEVIPTDKFDGEKNNTSEKNTVDSTTANIELNKKKEDANYIIEFSKKEDVDKQDKYDGKEKTKNTSLYENTNILYNQIVAKKLNEIKNSDKLFEILNEYKNNGKLVYGNEDAFSDPDRCDILVINPDTKAIVAYLVHKDKVLYNYLTQTMVVDYKTTFKGMIAIWIMYYVK